MVITYPGHSCFKIQTNVNGQSLVLVIDPFDKGLGLTPPRFGADIVLISHQHHDHNNAAAIAGQPFLIEGPGEYEIKGINIMGISSFHDQEKGSKRGLNTIYRIKTEEITLCHLGDLGQNILNEEQLEMINEIDILFVPVGGTYTLDAKEAAIVCNQIEPKIIIPMHYRAPGVNLQIEPVDKFLREIGAPKSEPIEKLTLKKKDLIEETKIILMKRYGTD